MKAIKIALILILAPLSVAARAEVPPAQQWVQPWNAAANHEDIGRLVAVDTPDRIYVAGSTYEPGVGGATHDYLLLQYDAAGSLVWQRRYGGLGGDMVSDLDVPTSGEIAVTGWSPGETGIEVATVKYDHLGNLLWDRRFPVQTFVSDHGPKLASDPDHNLLVSAAGDGDYLVLQYAPDGTLLWSRTHDGPAGDLDFATDVAVGPDGSVYVTGAADNLTRLLTVKYSAAGVFQWEQSEPGDIGSVFAPSHVRVAPDGDVVIAGSPESTCGVYQFKVWKCAAANGAVLWSDEAPSQPCSNLTFVDMAIDPDGNVLAVCSGSENGFESHLQVLRYSPAGVRSWIRELDGPGTSEDIAAAIATDVSGAAYVVGYTTFPPQNRDYLVGKFSPGGTLEWSVGWASDQGTNDIAHDIVVDPAGGVIVTGNSYHPVQNENVVTVKYEPAPTAEVADPAIPEPVPHPIVVAPNPMSAAATIRYTLAREGRLRLQVLTPDGRVVRTLHEGVATSGSHEFRWVRDRTGGGNLPAGIYLIRLMAEGTQAVAKVSLLR